MTELDMIHLIGQLFTVFVWFIWLVNCLLCLYDSFDWSIVCCVLWFIWLINCLLCLYGLNITCVFRTQTNHDFPSLNIINKFSSKKHLRTQLEQRSRITTCVSMLDSTYRTEWLLSQGFCFCNLIWTELLCLRCYTTLLPRKFYVCVSTPWVTHIAWLISKNDSYIIIAP